MLIEPHSTDPLTIPEFLRVDAAEQKRRREAGRGKRLRWTREMNFDRATKVEDPATTLVRKQVEAAERAKAQRKADERREQREIEKRLRTHLMPSTIGPKEAALRALKARGKNRTPATRTATTKPQDLEHARTMLHVATASPEAPKEPTMKNPTTAKAKSPKKAAKKAAAKKTAKKAAKKAAAPKKAKANTDGAASTIRPGSKLEIVAKLLQQEGGTTTAEVLEKTSWPTVSMPQQAKAAGLTLRKGEKVKGEPTRYFGTPAETIAKSE